ncbi:MAG: hypothetical protein OHK0029_14010 [Armatimonadaceae bacterium]
MSKASRVIIKDDPYRDRDAGKDWNKRGIWPAQWIALTEKPEEPFVAAYRCRFTVESDATVRVHVTADERYELFLDGERIGRGPERGDAENWFFETYDLSLATGEHTLVARVWSAGFEKMPYAQMTVTHGLLISPQDDAFLPLLGTGTAPWEGKVLTGYTFTHPTAAWGCGWNQMVDGAQFPWDFERGEGDGWSEVRVVEPGATAQTRNDTNALHRLTPAILPPLLDTPRQCAHVWMVADLKDAREEEAGKLTSTIPVRAADNIGDEQTSWQALMDGSGSVTVPAQTRRRILLALDDYYCAYPEVATSGGKGSRIRINWQEALFTGEDHRTKGKRDEVEGKFFTTIWSRVDGVGDSFLPDGGENRVFHTLWWQCGRFVEVVVETGDEPLILSRFTLRETRYPLESVAEFTADEERLLKIIPLAVRTLQMCAHETYFDCPFYEQLMYAGDTRLEVLTTYTITHDDRLPRKAVRMFHASRLPHGLTQSRYPSKVRQVIPPFSLWWIGMVHDFALYRGDIDYVRTVLPTVRTVMDAFLSYRNADGLVQAPPGWNYMDWVPEWKGGIPPDGMDGASSSINFLFALALTYAARIEEWVGEPEMASRALRLAGEQFSRTSAAFWNEERGIYADDLAKQHYSEHSQCLAILSGLEVPARIERMQEGLLQAEDLSRTTIYFTHYLFETFRTLGLPEALLNRMQLWFDLESLGFATLLEHPEPSRSDCHAWSSHPLFHYFATLLGIRPTAPGFTEVEIAPLFGPLTHLKGKMPHPSGEIVADLTRSNGKISGEIILPPGVTGVFRENGKETPLTSGLQSIG